MRLLITLAVFALSVSCSKSEIEPKSISQLLTQQEWILTGFGMDHNKNGLIDMQEELSEDCQRDNLYRFNLDGTGLFRDNIKSCNNGISEQSFSWKLQRNGLELDFTSGTLQILRINEHEMVLFQEMELADGSTIRFFINYKH